MLGRIFREAYAREHRSRMGRGPSSTASHWAQAFGVSMVGARREKTLDYGRTINPFATKAFFHSLADSIVIG